MVKSKRAQKFLACVARVPGGIGVKNKERMKMRLVKEQGGSEEEGKEMLVDKARDFENRPIGGRNARTAGIEKS